jgi:hypothetical protein
LPGHRGPPLLGIDPRLRSVKPYRATTKRSGWFGLVSDARGRDYGSMRSTTTIAARTSVSVRITGLAWALNGSSEV